MKKLRFVVSLTTNDNDYQMEQAVAAEETARRLGVDIQIIYADNDAIAQSQQLLKLIQSNSDAHPDAILLEPVGTALPQVARAAAAAGIGWVVLNREVDYIPELRRTYAVPIFAVTSDHVEIGRIQGRQFAALLPKGGSVLYIQGPSESPASQQRTAGMHETKPRDLEVKVLKGNWTEASAYKAVNSWLRLSTSQQSHMNIIAAQNDAMAVGAKKAFQELPDTTSRDRWLSLPYLGIDGLPKTGQAWVRRGLLAGTVVVPPNSGKALDMAMQAVQTGSNPAECTRTVPVSYPTEGALAAWQAEKARTLSV